jgi:3-hydroxyacyl-[acyl-carrier-protein] dehydratase
MAIYNNMDDLIPQRHPFVLIDKLIRCDETIVESSFKIPFNHPLVKNGKLCEGGLVENIAQTAAAGNGFEAKKKGLEVPEGFIAGIKKLKIIRLPLCNSKLLTTIIQKDRIMGFNLINGEIREGQDIIANCEMKIYCP